MVMVHARGPLCTCLCLLEVTPKPGTAINNPPRTLEGPHPPLWRCVARITKPTTRGRPKAVPAPSRDPRPVPPWDLCLSTPRILWGRADGGALGSGHAMGTVTIPPWDAPQAQSGG